MSNSVADIFLDMISDWDVEVICGCRAVVSMESFSIQSAGMADSFGFKSDDYEISKYL